MYIGNKKAEDNIFYNIGFVKGKIETLSYTNIPKNEVEILNEINNKMNLIFTQAVELEAKNKRIEIRR